MLRGKDLPGAAPLATYQGFRDPARSGGHGIGVAQRHQERSKLSRVAETRQNFETAGPASTELEADVTTALTTPAGAEFEGGPASWAGLLPGAEPLPGQLDRWLAIRGAELVAIRRHIHAHPEPSHSEFETAAMVARELAVAGLAPRLLPKGNGVICDIGSGDRVIALPGRPRRAAAAGPKDVPYRSTVRRRRARLRARRAHHRAARRSAWRWPSSTSAASCPAGSG